METRIDHYVEFYNHNLYTNKIESRIKFLEDNLSEFSRGSYGLYSDGFRFYDREIIVYNGNEYIGKEINYSPWINLYEYGTNNLANYSLSAEDYMSRLKRDCAKQLSLFK